MIILRFFSTSSLMRSINAAFINGSVGPVPSPGDSQLPVARSLLARTEQIVNRRSNMILGTGIDLIEVARIASSYEKFGERFVNRILLPDEIAYCLSHRQPAPFLAVRFARRRSPRRSAPALARSWAGGISRSAVRNPANRS
jgi:hypothetical protein